MMNAKAAASFGAGGFLSTFGRGNHVLGRPGNDLLFQVLRLSTIGAGEFNGRVRDGIGFRPPAIATRPAKDRNRKPIIGACNASVTVPIMAFGQAGRSHPQAKGINP